MDYKMRPGLSVVRMTVGGVLIGTAGVLDQILEIGWVSLGVLGTGVAVLISALIVRRPAVTKDDDYDAIADLELRSATWMSSNPIRMPSKEAFVGGEKLMKAVEALGAPSHLSASASRMMLLLSIQWKGNWWTWYRQLESDPKTSGLLMVPLATADIHWSRVPQRAAYLAQCVDRNELNKAVKAHFEDRISATVGQLVDAAKSKTVKDLVKKLMSEADGYRVRDYAEVLSEIAHADAILGCSRSRH